MTTKMQHRRGTASQWSSANPVLAAGELGVVTDTARVKCGNGSSAWNDLPFLTLADGEVTSAKIADGTIATGDIADAAVTYAKLGSDVRIGNLLTANQASVETDTSGWTVDGGGGVTLSKESSPTYYGSSSLLATCTGTGAGQFSAAGARIPVTAGDTVTFQAQTHAGVGARQVQALLLFYSAASGGTLIGGDSVKGPLVTTAGSWRAAALTTVVPSGATHAVPAFSLAAGGATDAVYFNAFSFHRGAGGTFALPGTPVTGQSHIATNGAVHLSGTGSPEGVVTAAPGSTWLQTDATTDVKGWIRWVKATGTGNTGWQVGPEADTGLRDPSSLLVNSWDTTVPDGMARLRRVGPLVVLRLFVKNGTAAKILTLPSGFRPQASIYQPVSKYNGPLVGGAYLAPSGEVEVYNAGGGAPDIATGFYLTVTYDTQNAWPTTLP